MSDYQFNRGCLHLDFAGGGEDGVVELACSSFLITDANLTSPADIQTVLASFWKATAPEHLPFLVIAKSVDEGTFRYLASLSARGLPAFIIEATGYGDHCREVLIDIATATGGRIFPEVPGVEGSRIAGGQIAAGEIGYADTVKMSADSIRIYGGAGSRGVVMQRIAKIRHEIETTRSGSDREILQERLESLQPQACY